VDSFLEVLNAQVCALSAAHHRAVRILELEVERLRADNARLALQREDVGEHVVLPGVQMPAASGAPGSEQLSAGASEVPDGRGEIRCSLPQLTGESGIVVDASDEMEGIVPCAPNGAPPLARENALGRRRSSSPVQKVEAPPVALYVPPVQRGSRRRSSSTGSLKHTCQEAAVSRSKSGTSRRHSVASSCSTGIGFLPTGSGGGPRISRVHNANASPRDSVSSSEGTGRSSSGNCAAWARRANSQESVSDADLSDASSDGVAFRLLPPWCHGPRRKSLLMLGNPDVGAQTIDLSTSDQDVVVGARMEKQYGILGGLIAKMTQPSSKAHISWQACGFAFIIMDVIVVPLEFFERPHSLGWISGLSCVFWTLDILNSFHTGYINAQGVVELRPAQVARRYAKSWLPLDALCTGGDWALLAVTSQSDGFAGELLSAARVLRAMRLIRLVKAPEIEAVIAEHVRSEVMSLVIVIVKVIILLLGVAHLIACAWYGLGRGSRDDGVAHGAAAAGTSWVRSRGLERAAFWERYTLALHWSLAQFVGESLLELHTVAERGFAICVLLFAFLFSALFVSSITTAMTRIQVLASQQASQQSALRRYLADNGISTSLAVRVQRNAQHAMCERKKQAPESSIELLQLVSEPLRAELHWEVRAPILTSHPFFASYKEVNPAGVRKTCHSAVSLLPVSHGDIIFSDLETSTCPRMFFVAGDGVLQYVSDAAGTGYLRQGCWAGEAALWTRWMHRGTLRADTDCTLLALDAEKFSKIVSPYPTSHAQHYAEAFVQCLNDCAISDLTDLQTSDLQHCLSRAFPEQYAPQEFERRASDCSNWSRRSTLRTSLRPPEGSCSFGAGVVQTHLMPFVRSASMRLL